MPVLGVERPDEERSVSKAQFEKMLEANGGQVPKEVGSVFLMCGWVFGAAKNYCDELIKWCRCFRSWLTIGVFMNGVFIIN